VHRVTWPSRLMSTLAGSGQASRPGTAPLQFLSCRPRVWVNLIMAEQNVRLHSRRSVRKQFIPKAASAASVISRPRHCGIRMRSTSISRTAKAMSAQSNGSAFAGRDQANPTEVSSRDLVVMIPLTLLHRALVRSTSCHTTVLIDKIGIIHDIRHQDHSRPALYGWCRHDISP
jgi:hypothetical protein